MTFSPLLAAVINAMLGWALFFLSLFLILLILVQRGRGGGLAGALGGPGGQSAFGTKAGDTFTRITSYVALGWIALCAFTMWKIGAHAPTAIAPEAAISASPSDSTSSSADLIDLGNLGGQEAAPAAADSPAEAATDSVPPVAPEPAAPAETGTEDALESAPATETANP